MSQSALDRYVAALATGQGLHDEFIYSMTFDDYTAFPDPFPRTAFSVREVEARIERYPNPARSQKLFQWDIHGRLLTPAKAALQGIAVVMIHGGAVNEFEFIFTPDGPRSIPGSHKNRSDQRPCWRGAAHRFARNSGPRGLSSRTLQPEPVATDPRTKTGVHHWGNSRG